MVATTQVQIPKSRGPTETPLEKKKSRSEELQALRIRNKVLTESLAAIQETAAQELKKSFDLVWFARYRYRYPNHTASRRIDEEHKDEIEKLKSEDGDFHHGFNSGMLAAVRMFKAKADILHINDFEDLSADLMAESVKHSNKIAEARKLFPNLEVKANDFPVSNK